MSAVEQLFDEIQREADRRPADVVLTLLAKYDVPQLDRACSKHTALLVEYTRAAIAYSRSKSQELSWAVISGNRRHMEQARFNYRRSVALCGCSDKYDTSGRKRKKHERKPVNTSDLVYDYPKVI